MEHIWSALCSKAIIDRRTNRITLVEALDVVQFDEEPPALNDGTPINIGPVSIEIVTFWYRSRIEEPEKGKARYTFVGPDGQAVGNRLEKDISLENGISQYAVTVMPTLPYLGLGLYRLVIEQAHSGEWIKQGNLPLLYRRSPNLS